MVDPTSTTWLIPLYQFCMDHHGGASSRLYSTGCVAGGYIWRWHRIQFIMDYELTDQQKQIYKQLEEKYNV